MNKILGFWCVTDTILKKNNSLLTQGYNFILSFIGNKF